MLLLADNDVLAKAAHWDLLDLVPRLIGGSWSDVAVLESLRHRTRRAADGYKDRLFASAEIANKLHVALQHAKNAPLANEGIRSGLADKVDIDPGEQILISALAELPSGTFLTGDKRALAALPSSLPADMLESLSGRCICTEQLIAFAIQELGIDAVRKMMLEHLNRDTAARIIMGADANRPASEVQLALTSYIDDLRSNCAGLLRG